MAKKTEMIEIAELKINLFVRSKLDVAHAVHFGELLENGVPLPPITLARGGTVIDGRHRIEAHQLLDRTTIEAIRLDIDDEDQLAVIAAAYQANIGGSLPPTREDTEHTVLMLLARGASTRVIAETLQFPSALARKYIKEVESKQRRALIQKAASAVTESDLTVPVAAEKFGVDVEQLKDFLSGGRKRKKAVEDHRRHLTKLCRSNSQKIAGVLKSAIRRFEDGECTEDFVIKLLDHLTKLQREAGRSLTDWRKRFDSIKSKDAESQHQQKAS